MKIICAAHPFLPGKIDLPHIASTYLPADIFNRLSKKINEDSLFICGLDIYGKHVARFIETEKTSHSNIIKEITEHTKSLFSYFNIAIDEFYYSNDVRLLSLHKSILTNLHKKKVIFKAETLDYKCKKCKRILSKSEIFFKSNKNESLKPLKKATAEEIYTSVLICCFCNEDTVLRRKDFVWKLSIKRRPIHSKILKDQKEKWLQKLISSALENDFDEWEFSRNNYFGNSLPIDPEHQLYIWFDSLISKLIPFERKDGFDFENYYKTDFTFFFGKNILKYYYLILPILFEDGLGGLPSSMQYSVRGFCNNFWEDSLNTFGETIKKYPIDYSRFYLAYVTPDNNKDFKLSEKNFKKVINSILIKIFLKYLKLAHNVLINHNIDYFKNTDKNTDKNIKEILITIKEGRTRKVLLYLEDIIQHRLINLKEESNHSYEFLHYLANEYHFIVNVLSCYMPTLLKSFEAFENHPVTMSTLSKESVGKINWKRIL